MACFFVLAELDFDEADLYKTTVIWILLMNA